ncbi:tripartite tricarboxylate transporter substrate binding protein [Pigmentiphaga litoralis]|uniref:tripartite tricarboxylate transporter substrate binding protein n=1 Tax=Pigmentiphaga litoralis TaxID=516702 RepID=UPI003B42C90F
MTIAVTQGARPAASGTSRTPVFSTVLASISLAAAAIVTVSAAAFPGAAQAAYPDKPVRMVVAFSPGGPTDVLARLFAQKLADQLGQPVVVENRPGAGGNLASDVVANAPADGYTLLYNSSSVTISPALFNTPRLDPRKIFTPVAYVATVPLVLIVNPSVDAKTPKEFVELLKRKPGALNFGSSGNGTIDHLTAVLFGKQTGVTFSHVPYKGNAAALPDLLAGRIDFMMSGSLNAFMPFVKEGRLRAIAATTAQRVSILPDTPTLGETVAPGFDSGTWQGIVGPAALPAPVVTKLNEAVNKVLAQPDTRDSLIAQGAMATGGTPGDYGKLIGSEYERWTRIIKETGTKSD